MGSPPFEKHNASMYVKSALSIMTVETVNISMSELSKYRIVSVC